MYSLFLVIFIFFVNSQKGFHHITPASANVLGYHYPHYAPVYYVSIYPFIHYFFFLNTSRSKTGFILSI